MARTEQAAPIARSHRHHGRRTSPEGRAATRGSRKERPSIERDRPNKQTNYRDRFRPRSRSSSNPDPTLALVRIFSGPESQSACRPAFNFHMLCKHFTLGLYVRRSIYVSIGAYRSRDE
ncbi:hypothetical protein EVAR_64106_1 [Eumeta japonica]|uniref:Uncharacterized protein n=1 Tax=Eumeta variegata TaxID=151549 RepID=A0A4C1ZK25_EUMVA|nr:hypothetical protein EVAR_64106_1 [Eumeta japonica]